MKHTCAAAKTQQTLSVYSLIVFGDNPECIRSEAAFAKLCGVRPVPASSGKVTRRLRRGGNRRANAALLIPSCPHADLCGAKGRAWLVEQVVPQDEQLVAERHLREFDRLGEDLKVIERDLSRSALADEGLKRLMTIPRVAMVVALAMMAAIGDVARFEGPEKLVSYLSLNPSVRQSGPGPAYHGRITKQGAATHAACWWRPPGRRHKRLVQCGPSFSASGRAAASTSRPWRPRASLPS